MDFIKWLQAYATVYSRRARNLSAKTIIYLAALVVVALLALILGPLGMLALAVIVLFVLPAINTDVRSEVEQEYNNRKNS